MQVDTSKAAGENSATLPIAAAAVASVAVTAIVDDFRVAPDASVSKIKAYQIHSRQATNWVIL